LTTAAPAGDTEKASSTAEKKREKEINPLAVRLRRALAIMRET
jgi:hypothetical protein